MGEPSRVGRAEPRFDIDLSYGQQGEKLIGTFLEWITNGNGQVEVKRKSYLDLMFYVETHCDKGKTGNYRPSGISVSTATAWAFVLGDTKIAVIIPADELRALIDDPSSKDREETHGSCPTRGKLIDLAVALHRHKQRASGIVRDPVPSKVEYIPSRNTVSRAVDPMSDAILKDPEYVRQMTSWLQRTKAAEAVKREREPGEDG